MGWSFGIWKWVLDIGFGVYFVNGGLFGSKIFLVCLYWV